jgi:hypothetical protein
MAQDLGMLTNMWMVDPTMFDPTQASNQFSNFNNNPFPWPPSYNTGAGGPVNAATGEPIASFQQWQQANPAGVTINQTPSQPQAPPSQGFASMPPGWGAGLGLTPQQTQARYYQQMGDQAAQAGLAGMQNGIGGNAATGAAMGNLAQQYYQMGQQPQQTAPQAAPQASGPPNNWQAAINALANPGNPQTMGANVPMMTGSQPAGGVNNAFLQQAGSGAGMNQNFLSALRAIQGRPQ